MFSCSRKTAFTLQMQQRHNYSQVKLQKVQFYTSNEIVLERTFREGESYTKKGKLTQIDKTFTETIIVPKNTPCVLETLISNDKMVFSFGSIESKDHTIYDNVSLVFGNETQDRSPYYYLMAKNWQNDVGEIDIDGTDFYTSNDNAYLLIKHKHLRFLSRKEYVVKGRRVNK